MKTERMESKVQVYVCNHKRDDSECCFDRGSKELTDDLRKWTKENHKGKLKIYRSGCLGRCSEGIAIACYPLDELILEATVEDAPKIKEGLEKALSSKN